MKTLFTAILAATVKGSQWGACNPEDPEGTCPPAAEGQGCCYGFKIEKDYADMGMVAG